MRPQEPDLSLFHAQGKIGNFWLLWKWSISPCADQDPLLLPLQEHAVSGSLVISIVMGGTPLSLDGLFHGKSQL